MKEIRIMKKQPLKKERKARPTSRQDLLRLMFEKGLIDQIPVLSSLDTDAIEPVRIQGKPISEVIIEERR